MDDNVSIDASTLKKCINLFKGVCIFAADRAWLVKPYPKSRPA
jgi:hypothetical protein